MVEFKGTFYKPGGTMYKGPTIIDPNRFNDPVALMTDWEPVSDGASFRTHKLVRVNPNKVVFKMTGQLIAFFSILPLAGVLLLIYVFSGHMSFLPLFLGIIFVLFGVYLLLYQTDPIVFDKSTGMFLKGRKKKDKSPDPDNPKNIVALDKVHALQLLSQYVPGKRAYYSHELNLVLNNGKRVRVISHANKEKFMEDVRLLSEFLGTPIWDATE
ncbi:MAG: hypothetical protein GX091_00510 [Peptococcaceae bacterium]|nr:hypothetical protein [Peptococcaceae bacterium]